MSNLPSWPSASKVYSKAYKYLNLMGINGHAKPARKNKRGKIIQQGSVSNEMEELIDALNSGNEEKLKGLMFLYMSDRRYNEM